MICGNVQNAGSRARIRYRLRRVKQRHTRGSLIIVDVANTTASTGVGVVLGVGMVGSLSVVRASGGSRRVTVATPARRVPAWPTRSVC